MSAWGRSTTTSRARKSCSRPPWRTRWTSTAPRWTASPRAWTTGRLHRRNPELSKVLLHHGPALTASSKGLAPRARRDIDAGVETGRFTVRDAELAMVTIAGAALCLGRLLHDHPDRDDAEASDRVAEDLLRMLGVPAEEAREISRRELPDLADLPPHDSVA